MSRHPSVSPTPRRIISILLVPLILIIFLVPYLWMLASSLKTPQDTFADLASLSWRTLLPLDPVLSNFRELFEERGIGRALLNSVIVGVVQVIGSLIVCSLAAYALTRIRFPGRNVVFALLLVPFLVPGEVLVVPLYSVVSGMGLDDTLYAVALPFVASAFGLFVLRQSFDQIPREIDDAARLDGAGHLRTFWFIILPNARPALATTALIIFMFSWNSLLWPLIILQSPENLTVQAAIAQSVPPGTTPNWGLSFAGGVVATAPVALLYLFLQRHFVRGLTQS